MNNILFPKIIEIIGKKNRMNLLSLIRKISIRLDEPNIRLNNRCADTCIIVKSLLKSKNIECKVVQNEYETHVWIQIDNYIVDPTFGQFSNESIFPYSLITDYNIINKICKIYNIDNRHWYGIKEYKQNSVIYRNHDILKLVY